MDLSSLEVSPIIKMNIKNLTATSNKTNRSNKKHAVLIIFLNLIGK